VKKECHRKAIKNIFFIADLDYTGPSYLSITRGAVSFEVEQVGRRVYISPFKVIMLAAKSLCRP